MFEEKDLFQRVQISKDEPSVCVLLHDLFRDQPGERDREQKCWEVGDSMSSGA